MSSVCKDVTICGPEKDTCIANLTLKDKSCLVPCDGLYADVADNSLKQNVMKGKNPLNSYYSTFVDNYYHLGFQTITDELGKANKRFDVLQQMFPDLSADEESKSVDSLTRIYHNYKREYVKHLSFNPGTENLSKYILMTLLGFLFSTSIIDNGTLCPLIDDIVRSPLFSHCNGTLSPESSLHLL